MNQLVQQIESKHITSLGFEKKRFNFKVGDDVIVDIKIPDKNGFRIQKFVGRCIAITKPNSINSLFTVIKHQGTKVIRKFPMFSPLIENVTVKTVGFSRRSKLYHLIDKNGKAARIREPKIAKKVKIKNTQV
jgi:large subunit ribosomal protein L19